jgi:hypothetical protein
VSDAGGVEVAKSWRSAGRWRAVVEGGVSDFMNPTVPLWQ